MSPTSNRLAAIRYDRGFDIDALLVDVCRQLAERGVRLDEWQHFYNWHRPHSSLGGKTPNDVCHELSQQTPLWDEVIAGYDTTSERLREQNFTIDQAVNRLK